MAARGRVTFGIKTSHSNTTYDEILGVWLEPDSVLVIEANLPP